MNLHYKIVEVWPSDHLIVVRYWTDILSEEFLASDENRREDGTPVRCRTDVSLTLAIPAPVGEDLEKIIVGSAPIDWLKTLEKVQMPEVDTSMDSILNIKDQQFTVVGAEKKIASDDSVNLLTDEEIEEIIQKVTTNKNA